MAKCHKMHLHFDIFVGNMQLFNKICVPLQMYLFIIHLS